MVIWNHEMYTGALLPCGGVLRGTGNQKVGAIVNAIGYYVIGLPIGITLMFAAKLGVIGKPHCGKTGKPPTGPGRMAKHVETSLCFPQSCTVSEREYVDSG